FSSRRRHTRFSRDWSSDVCSSDLLSSVKKQLEFVKSVDGVRRIVNDLTWDTSIPLMLEGNGSFERTIIGELYGVADRHDGYVPRSEERRVGKECVFRSGAVSQHN